MKLYTSYFAQLKNFPKNLIGLSTAVWNPKWLEPYHRVTDPIWLDIPPLKPGRACAGLCNGKCAPKHPEDCDFLKVYYQQLQAIDFQEFYQKLERLNEKIRQGENLLSVDFAFLVYEAPANLCSERQVIQKWIRENGVEINEWHK